MFKSIARVLFLTTLLAIVTSGQPSGDENCETLMSEIHITKGIKDLGKPVKEKHRSRTIFIPDEYDEAGSLSRTCSGDVSVTKCEGFCNSQVQPSVITTTGFLKVQ